MRGISRNSQQLLLLPARKNKEQKWPRDAGICAPPPLPNASVMLTHHYRSTLFDRCRAIHNTVVCSPCLFLRKSNHRQLTMEAHKEHTSIRVRQYSNLATRKLPGWVQWLHRKHKLFFFRGQQKSRCTLTKTLSTVIQYITCDVLAGHTPDSKEKETGYQAWSVRKKKKKLSLCL